MGGLDMEIRQLQYFIEIVRRKGFTAAAAALYTTQPGLTKSIKQLEDELGVCLIDRNKRVFKLTEEGQVFYERAQDICSRIDDLYSVMRDTSANVSGRVNIGTVTIANVFFRELEASFSSRFPDAYLNILEMTSREIKNAVLAHRCDIGFAVLPVAEKPNAALEIKVISSDAMVDVMHKEHPLDLVITPMALLPKPLSKGPIWLQNRAGVRLLAQEAQLLTMFSTSLEFPGH